MYKRPFFRFLVIPSAVLIAGLFLLSSRIFVYAARGERDLDSAKDKINKLIDSGKSSQAIAIEDKLIADNQQDPCLPKAISDMADSRAQLPCHDYGRARALYNRLIQLHPHSAHAKRAALEVSKLDIFTKMETGDINSAGSDIEQLITNNTANPYLSEALCDIAVRFTKRCYFKQADALYGRLIAICPADSFTEKAEFEQIKNKLFSEFMQGGLAVEDLLGQTADKYPNHKHLPGVLYFAADKYEENYNYPKARALYNQALAINPESSCGRKSALDIARLDIYEKINDCNFGSAQDLTEKLIAEHSADSYFPEVLYNIADYYRKCSNYERARQVYSRLIETCPEDRYSARAQAEIALLDIRSKIAMGTFDPNAGEIKQFINGRQKDYLLARRLYELGDYCIYDGDYDAASSIFQTVWQQFGDFSYYSTRAKICDDTARICSQVKAGNLTDAQTGLAKMRQDYPNYYYLACQLYFIATVYLDYDYPQQAGLLCDEVINMGEGKYAAFCNMFKYRLDIHSLLQANDLAGARKVLDNFKSKYADLLYLAEGLIEVAEEFYNKGISGGNSISKDCLQEAAAIYRTCRPVEADLKIWAYMMLAHSDFGLGNFAESASYCRKIVNGYPDSGSAWHAGLMTGRAYEGMQKTGALSGEEAAGRIEAAKKIYAGIIQNYPTGADPVLLAQATAHLAKYELFSAVESGSDAAVDTVINQLPGRLGDANERLDECLYVLTGECSNRGHAAKVQGDVSLSTYYYETAMELGERLFTQCPASPHAGSACFAVGLQLAQEFSDYAGAIEYCQKVIDNWPGSEYADWAQVKIGTYLEAMVKADDLTIQAGRPLIIAAYRKAIDNYPKSKWVTFAKERLESLK